MKRLAVLVAFITVALVLPSSGALAKKGKQPASTYEVTMEFVGTNQGLSTTCTEAGVIVDPHPIVMTGSLTNVLSVWQPMLETDIQIPWFREYPLPGIGGNALTGCHGDVDVEVAGPGPEVFPGAIWLTFGKDSGKDTVTFQWRFDYYWQFGEEETRGKKTHYPQEVLEMFELKSEKLVLGDGVLTSSSPMRVTGPFSVSLFTKTEAGITHFWEPTWTADLTFDLTITPLP